MPKVSQAHLDARRAQILQAGAACFVEMGFVATQMREVADRAQVSTGTLYRYFDGKEDLFRAVMEGARVQERAARQRAFGGEGRAVDRLERLPERLLEKARTDLAQIRRNFRDYGEAATNAFLRNALGGAVAETVAELEALVREAQAEGDLRPELDARTAAGFLATQVVAADFSRLFDARFDPGRYQRCLEAAVSGLLRGPSRAGSGGGG